MSKNLKYLLIGLAVAIAAVVPAIAIAGNGPNAESTPTGVPNDEHQSDADDPDQFHHSEGNKESDPNQTDEPSEDPDDHAGVQKSDGDHDDDPNQIGTPDS